MLSVYKLFMPGDDAGGFHLALWSFMLSLGITMMLIPYYAWGAELSTDYRERSKVTGSRAIFNALGSLSAQLVPAVALLLFGLGGSGVVLELVGTTMLVLMPICVLLTVTNVPEPAYVPQKRVSVREGLKVMFSNGPFKRLVGAFMI